MVPRKKREEGEGFIHHATMQGVNHEPMFTEDEDRAGYRLMLAATVLRFGWRCFSYCQMTTHVHLVVMTPDANLGAGMQWLCGQYARRFNDEHRRPGHLFRGRYHTERIKTDSHLLNAVGYVVVNPVTAGICRDPRDWEWGSHASVSRGKPPPWLAHDLLVRYLDAVAGDGAYDELLGLRLGSG